MNTIKFKGEVITTHITSKSTSGQIDVGLIEGLVAGEAVVVNHTERRATVHVPLNVDGKDISVRLTVKDRGDLDEKILLGRAFLEACESAGIELDERNEY